jgi:hypothetical protein
MNDGFTIDINGNKYWRLNDQWHREDGPAVDHFSGYQAWYYHGTRVQCNSQEEFVRMLKLKAFW